MTCVHRGGEAGGTNPAVIFSSFQTSQRAASRVPGVQVALHLPRRVPEEPRFEDAGRRVGAELALCGVESVLRAHGAAHAGNGGPAEERALCGRNHDPEAGRGARHAAMSTQSNPRKTQIQTTEEEK